VPELAGRQFPYSEGNSRPSFIKEDGSVKEAELKRQPARGCAYLNFAAQ
jgi:hypothetical protein